MPRPASRYKEKMSPDAVSPAPPAGSAGDLAELRERLTALEAENARLRADPFSGDGAPDAAERRAGLWRGILSAVCLVLASVLVPLSVVGTWARAELVDEDRFIATFAPLASDPDVQALIIDQTTAAIDEQVDFEAITDELFDGIQQLGLPPRASSALDLLRAPAAQGLQGLVDNAVTTLVTSDVFAGAWRAALQQSHRTLVSAASGTVGGAVSISGTGELGIELGPIVAEVKQRLTDQGVGLASMIPSVDRTIVVAQSSALTAAGVVYNLAVGVGWWLPVVALVLFGVGILLARRRSTALLGGGIGLAVGAGVLAIALAVGAGVMSVVAVQLAIPAPALGAIYAQVVADMQSVAVVLALIGVVLALLAWVGGLSRPAATVRTAVGSVNSGIRRALARRGVDLGAFGAWMHAQRVLVRVVLAVLLVLWLLLLRPLGIGDVFLVAIVGLVLWWLTELAQRRPDEQEPVDEDAEALAAASSSTS